MEKLIESPSYKELRQYTQLDEFGAGLGSKALLEELCARLKDDKALRDAAEQVNQAAEHQKKAEDLQKQLDEMLDSSKNGNKNDNKNGNKSRDKKRLLSPQRSQEEILEAMVTAQQHADKAKQIIAGAQSQIRRAITVAAEKATAECEETDALLTSWGFNQGHGISELTS